MPVESNDGRGATRNATPTRFNLKERVTEGEWLDKVEEGAKRKLKDPGLIVTFQDPQGHVLKEYVAMPLMVYERLMRKIEGV